MLEVHRSERTAPLADALGAVLRVPLPDPFATEVVAVPAKGVERWLTQRLSTVLGAGPAGDGICAGVAFPSPSRLVGQALAAAGGTSPLDGTAVHDDPWAEPLWPLLEVVDASLDEPWCSVLAAHLGHRGRDTGAGGAAATTGDDSRRGRRWATAAHLAELFRSYATARPDMLRDWAAGHDTDGARPLDDDVRWQAELWRALRAQLGPSPAELLDERCAALREAPELSDLPSRLSVFGATRLSTDALAVLAALAEHRDVHLFLPHPSPALWALLEEGARPVRRADDRDRLPAHPLLRSLARDVRELQLRLPEHVASHHPDRPRPDTLLGRLQDDLRDDRVRSAQRPVDPLDRSVQVHACHGAGRQVEVLRELLLRMFQDDATLEPRDVLVLCPDVETFAPLVSAAFGLPAPGTGLPHPGHALRVRLADRSLRRTNPLLDTVARLLDLAGSRVTASAVLDLAATPGVRRRFDLTDDDLDRVRDWVAGSGVRWGLDAAGRAPYGLDTVTQNTWRAGLDRVLLGVTTSEDEPVWLGLALPLDDVGSGDVDLAGRLAELVDRVEVALDALSGEHPAGHWVDALTAALEQLTDVGEAEAWQLGQARRELAEVAAGATSTLGLADVRAMLADLLRGRPTRANFRTGTLTVCTLVPMRSVPHRVVVLLGLDDGVYPRAGGVDGDDVLARDPHLGERDVRTEDRQLLLDAVLSAGERLVVLFTGADPVSGAPRPPAVPVGELLDVLAAGSPGVREHVVVRHPLQPYDPTGFTGAQPFSFDPVNLAGARRAALPRELPPPRQRLPGRTGPVALDDLVAFVEHPVRAYLRQRLRITLPGEDDEVADGLPVALDALQEWAIGERMLRDRLRGLEPAAGRHAEWLRGTLPPGALGHAVLEDVQAKLEPVVAACTAVLKTPSRAVDVRLKLGARVLSGTVDDVRDGAAFGVAYSTLAPKHRLRGWVLALALACAGEGDRAVVVGREGRRARTSVLLAPADPQAALADLLDLYERGMREPLPLVSRTSAAYATSRLGGDDVEHARQSAASRWRNDFGGEQDDRHHRWAWGDLYPLEQLMAGAPLPGEEQPDERTRFGALARRLWTPVLAAEESS